MTHFQRGILNVAKPAIIIPAGVFGFCEWVKFSEFLCLKMGIDALSPKSAVLTCLSPVIVASIGLVVIYLRECRQRDIADAAEADEADNEPQDVEKS